MPPLDGYQGLAHQPDEPASPLPKYPTSRLPNLVCTAKNKDKVVQIVFHIEAATLPKPTRQHYSTTARILTAALGTSSFVLWYTSTKRKHKWEMEKKNQDKYVVFVVWRSTVRGKHG
jgi:hypothetical protein